MRMNRKCEPSISWENIYDTAAGVAPAPGVYAIFYLGSFVFFFWKSGIVSCQANLSCGIAITFHFLLLDRFSFLSFKLLVL